MSRIMATVLFWSVCERRFSLLKRTVVASLEMMCLNSWIEEESSQTRTDKQITSMSLWMEMRSLSFSRFPFGVVLASNVIRLQCNRGDGEMISCLMMMK